MLIKNPSTGNGLSLEDKEILAEGLNALLLERSRAYALSVQVAKTKGHGVPDVRDFGLPDILRLTRIFAEPLESNRFTEKEASIISIAFFGSTE